MKILLIAIGLLLTASSYGQKYNVGIVRMGPDIKDLEGQIVLTDSTLNLIFDGQLLALKITSRNGYTIHVTDGKLASKYVIAHAAGRIHGFTYDRSITYHPEKHHVGHKTSIFYCLIERK